MSFLGSLYSDSPSPLTASCCSLSFDAVCHFAFPVTIGSSSSAVWRTRLLIARVWALMPSIPRMTRSGVASSKPLSLFLGAKGFGGIPRLGLWFPHSPSCGCGCVCVGCWLVAFLWLLEVVSLFLPFCSLKHSSFLFRFRRNRQKKSKSEKQRRGGRATEILCCHKQPAFTSQILACIFTETAQEVRVPLSRAVSML